MQASNAVKLKLTIGRTEPGRPSGMRGNPILIEKGNKKRGKYPQKSGVKFKCERMVTEFDDISIYVKVQTQFVCLGYLSLANV